jgi:hypothetical protein
LNQRGDIILIFCKAGRFGRQDGKAYTLPATSGIKMIYWLYGSSGAAGVADATSETDFDIGLST